METSKAGDQRVEIYRSMDSNQRRHFMQLDLAPVVRAVEHSLFFFFQAEDGIRDVAVTGVQTCALPICSRSGCGCCCSPAARGRRPRCSLHDGDHFGGEYQMKLLTLGLAVPLFVAAAPAAGAQEAPKAPEALQVGADAPDFALPGATRYGVLRNPIHLSDFKGKTVVLAFFYKARTKG